MDVCCYGRREDGYRDFSSDLSVAFTATTCLPNEFLDTPVTPSADICGMLAHLFSKRVLIQNDYYGIDLTSANIPILRKALHVFRSTSQNFALPDHFLFEPGRYSPLSYILAPNCDHPHNLFFPLSTPPLPSPHNRSRTISK